MISIQAALEIIRAHTPAAQLCEAPLSQTLGQVLARDVYSDIRMPPFDRATMDGYAFHCADVSKLNTTLKVIGESVAGRRFTGAVGPGEAVQIMTGAPVPAGADCVQIVEKATARDGQVIIHEPVEKGKNITPAGSEIAVGDKLSAGRYLGPAEMAVLAIFGTAIVPVFRPPTVALLTTGDELVDLTGRPGPDQIRNSNVYSLIAQVRSCGIEPVDLGIATDEQSSLQEKVQKAIQYDIAVTTGGVSMGKYDLVADVLRHAGARIHFDKVAIKPGKPLTFATRERNLFFGLPGNPVSSFITFEVFVRPVLGHLMGRRTPLAEVRARIKNRFVNRGSRDYYAPARTRWRGNHWETEILNTSGSADIFRFSAADSLLILPSDSDSQAGMERTVLLLSDYLERITSS